MTKQTFAAYWLTCVLMMAFAAVASATTIVLPSDEQLIQKSPLIIRGVVVSSAAVDRDGAIWTETVVQVDQRLKGEAPATVTIREIGGIVGDRITKIFGAPEYVRGEHVLAFLTPTVRGDYQTVDLFVGKFTEAKTVGGERVWRRDAAQDNVTLLDADFRPLATKNVQRDANAFETYVADRAAGREGRANYGLENPVLAPAPQRLQTSANFTLISEPSVYRWFAFDTGGSAAWFSSGTQPGYSGGGVTELTTAMNVWTSYSAAKIRYSYNGTFSGTPAGLARPNGTNEVLFNDPLNEIAGSWNPSTGGVVGQGGFNGVSNSASWTAPFTADATHTQQTYRAWNITEGNLVIQDNVSPGQRISSGTLAEIVAHEFGHTLGFGHSDDSTALMYATVTGLGASLRADDQVAARWLYPNGSSTPPPASQAPAAPTNLAGSAASSSSVSLQWSDNSSNESGFHIYYAAGASGGSFALAGSVAAGVTTASATGLGAGTHRFYVTAFNSTGESSASNVVTVTIQSSVQFGAAFSITPDSGIAGQTSFTVTDQSTGTIASRTWNFGDGTTATTATASHVYATAGTYTITLTVRSNTNAQSQATRIITVTSPAPSLNAAFSYSPASPFAGEPVSFIDQSTGGVTSWLWNFGDGSASSNQNPVKTYASAGSYNVTLTIYRGADTRVATTTVSIATKIPATPVAGPFTSLVPVTAQTNGANGSIWRTELTLFNAGGESADVALTFVPGAGVAPQTRTIVVLPRETRTYANALLDLFGMPSGAGGISVNATSATTTPDLRVTSRTFAATPGGTYGQAVPDVASSDLQNTLYLTGIISSADFRTNIGIVNKSANFVPTTLTLIDANGRVVDNASLSVPPNSFQQASLAGYFPAANGGNYSLMSMRVGTASRDAVSVYASVVDNKTQDPVYIQAMPLASSGPITLPVVARANGANGTFWRSDVAFFNPGNVTANLSIAYRAPNATRTRTVSVAPNSSVVLADVVTAMGEPAGSGLLDVSWIGTAVPVVTSRTYTTAANGGTFGQSVDAVGRFAREQYVTGLRSDVDFRTNVGFVNGGNNAISIHAAVLSSSGTQIGVTDLTIPAHTQVQYPLTALVQGLDQYSIGSCTLQARSNDAATLFVYGSVVDNNTGDPVFFAGK